MKKISFILMALVCCSAMMAGDMTARAIITMSTISGAEDELEMYEVAEFTSAFEGGYDVRKLMNTGSTALINVFARTEAGDLSSIFTNDLAGTPIVITTNGQTTKYTFTFSQVIGNLILEDMLLHTYTTMTEGGKYSFSADMNQTISDRFRIYKPGEFKVCTTFDHVEIYENTGTNNIVVTNAAGETVVDVAPVPVYQTIDLSGKPSGHYFLTVNGETYEFCNKPVSE